MSSPKDTPFTKPNSESQYGKTPLESWVGTVVSYDAQKEQIESGWGWRYKVRIMGDNTNSDQITDEQLSYAYVLLPTTAGSGGAFKMRSVRISQGDFVYGVRGGGAGAPTMILGVFPRTKNQEEGKGNFKNSTGFYGSLNSDSEILDGEFNEQTGPATPNTDPVGPKNYNKAEQREPSDKSEQLGVTAVGDENVDVEKKLTPQKNIQSSEEYNKNVQKGEIAVKNEETLDNITEGALNGDIDPTVAIVATDSAVKENIIEESVGNDIKKNLEEKTDEFKGEKMVEVKNPKGDIILLPESVVEGGFTFASENKDDEDDDVTFERVVDNKGNITFKSTSKETKETVTGSSSVNITYDEETNTFTSESVTTSSQTISGLVVGSEAPKNDTDIKLRLIQNQKRLNYFIKLYNSPTFTGNREEKIAEAKNYIKQLENFENNPGDYNGSSLQATLKSKYDVNY